MSIYRLLKNWVEGLAVAFTLTYWISEYLQWDMESALFLGNNVLIFYLVIGWSLVFGYFFKKRVLNKTSKSFEQFLLNEVSWPLTDEQQKPITELMMGITLGAVREISILSAVNYGGALILLFVLGVISPIIIATFVMLATVVYFTKGLKVKDSLIAIDVSDLLLSVLNKTSDQKSQ